MGKSGFLPDVSSQFAFWREYAVNALREHNHESAQAGLYNLNQCLTDEYLVRISNEEYSELISDRIVFQCGHCTMENKEIINKGEENEKNKVTIVPTEIHYLKMEIYERQLSITEKLLFSFREDTDKIKFRNNSLTTSMNVMMNGFTVSQNTKTTIKYWVCPECHQDNFQKDGEWNTIKSIREQPFTLGVIPEPPKKQKHLSQFLGYPQKFNKWFYNFLEELQAKLVLYRIEYVSQNGHEMIEPEYKDKGDHAKN